MMLGSVDAVDDHHIATEFVLLLIPSRSMYVTSVSMTRHGNRTEMKWGGIFIPLVWKSVALAYPRVWLWFLAIAWPFLSHWGENVSRIPSSTWWISGAMIAAALLALLPGRLSAHEKKRLRALGAVTGWRIDPRRLFKQNREAKRWELEQAAKEGSLPTTPEAALAAAPTLAVELVPRVYALACYSAVDDPAWRPAAAALLTRQQSIG
jgi:hypothetical protein